MVNNPDVHSFVHTSVRHAFLAVPFSFSGTCILDLSKLTMLKFWYDVAMPTWHDPPRSLLTLHLSDTGVVWDDNEKSAMRNKKEM